MKFIKKTLLLALASIAFFSCSNLETAEKIQPNDGMASVSFNFETAARTILPTVNLNSCTYTVTGKLKGTSEVQTLLTKESYAKLTTSGAMTVKLGEWEFTVTAYDGDTAVLSGTTETRITTSENIIRIILNATGIGTGSVKVSVTNFSDAVKKITAGLYESMEAATTDSGEELTFASRWDVVVFEKNNVPVTAGEKECFVKFFFYDAGGACIKTLVESVYVVAGKTSFKAIDLNYSSFNTFKVGVYVKKDNGFWANSGKIISLSKDGVSYTLDLRTTHYVEANISSGTYKVYDNEKDTGITFTPTATASTESFYINFYTVEVKAGSKTIASDFVPIGGTYSFNLKDGCCSVQSVKLGEDELTAAADGTYSINNVTSALTVNAELTDHIWSTTVDGDTITYNCSTCSKTKSFTKGVPIAATAENVNDIINSLPENASFVYDIALTGKISDAVIANLGLVLKNKNRLVALDMSSTTGLTSLAKFAFYMYSSLVSVKLPNTITSIGNSAFALTSLVNITLPEGVTSIGNDAFDWCDKLESVTLPESIETLKAQVFNYCTSLTTVTIKATNPPKLDMPSGTSVFPDNVTNFYVPSSSVTTYQGAEGWSTYASKISAIVE